MAESRAASGIEINAVSPWASAVSYWKPSHVVESAWVEHGPFAAWLIDVVRPRILVELGTHNGYSFFAFCEAARRLNSTTQLFAIDTWIGDDHAGFYGNHVYDEVSRVCDENYPESTHLLRGYFDDFVATFADNSVDVIHIDGRHEYEDVRHDYESWLTKLSPGGVVLFHDVAVMDRGFGVYRLWGELVADHPGASFSFEHGHGLGVLAPKGEPAEKIRPLFTASVSETLAVRDFYAGLGRSISEEFVSSEARVATQQHIENLERALDDTRNELSAVLSSLAWTVTRPIRALTGALPRGKRNVR